MATPEEMTAGALMACMPQRQDSDEDGSQDDDNDVFCEQRSLNASACSDSSLDMSSHSSVGKRRRVASAGEMDDAGYPADWDDYGSPIDGAGDPDAKNGILSATSKKPFAHGRGKAAGRRRQGDGLHMDISMPPSADAEQMLKDAVNQMLTAHIQLHPIDGEDGGDGDVGEDDANDESSDQSVGQQLEVEAEDVAADGEAQQDVDREDAPETEPAQDVPMPVDGQGCGTQGDRAEASHADTDRGDSGASALDVVADDQLSCDSSEQEPTDATAAHAGKADRQLPARDNGGTATAAAAERADGAAEDEPMVSNPANGGGDQVSSTRATHLELVAAETDVWTMDAPDAAQMALSAALADDAEADAELLASLSPQPGDDDLPARVDDESPGLDAMVWM